MNKSLRLLLSFLFLVSFFGMSIFLRRPFIWLGYLIMISSAIHTFNKKDKFEKTIICYCFFVFLSCLYSWIFNEQPIISAIEASYHYFGVLFYFVVKLFSPSKNESFKFLRRIMIITAICYVIQWIVYPVVIFEGSVNEFDINENTFRMRFYCSFLFYLMVLYGINKYAVRHRLIYITYSLVGLLPVFIMGFRSLIAMLLVSILMTIIATTKRNAFSYLKYIIVGAIMLYAILQVPIVQEKVDEMMERQESEQTFGNEDYIRNLALVYYTSEFSENLPMWLFGGGHPQIGTEDSPRNHYQRIFANGFSLQMYWNDLGLIGLSCLIGIISVLILVYMCIKIMYECNYKDLQFIRFGIFCVLISTIITSMELYRNGNLVVLGLLFFIVHKNKIKPKPLIKR